VPRGYWVVGNRAGAERGAFVQRDGSLADDPRFGRLCTTSEILSYGAPHGG
jgi:hypothetical protein